MSIRLFAALDLPDHIAEPLLWLMRGVGGAKWRPRENLHLTLRFFGEIDQSKLAQGAGITLHRSTLLEFGNPPLGTQFITARAEAGLDWPVRLLVTEDERGDVWAVYTDFDWIAQRPGITNRSEQFKTASGVVASITGAVTK